MDAFRAGFGIAWNGLTADQRRVVRADALAIFRDEMDGGDDTNACEVGEAVVELRRRIGGPVALAGYADVLLAGERFRKAGV